MGVLETIRDQCLTNGNVHMRSWQNYNIDSYSVNLGGAKIFPSNQLPGDTDAYSDGPWVTL